MKYKDKLSGLTLVEMIVSISIVALVSSLFIANYHSTNKRADLVMSAQNLVADIHGAQNNSLGLVKYNNAVPAGGWGVQFNLSSPHQYKIFADLDAPGTEGYLEYDEHTEGLISAGARQTLLSDQLIISALRVGGQAVSWANVTFLPPDPITNINSNLGSSSTLDIELTEGPSGFKKTIQVNFLGLAEVID